MGASDFKSPEEELSQAHKNIDPRKLKCIGRAIDFNTGLPLPILPEVFNWEEHLSYLNVGTSLMNLFGLDPSEHWEIRRGVKAKPFAAMT